MSTIQQLFTTKDDDTSLLLQSVKNLHGFIDAYDEIHRPEDRRAVLDFLVESIDYLKHDFDVELIPNSLNRLKATLLSAGRIGGETLGAAIVIDRTGKISMQLSERVQESAPYIIKDTMQSIDYILNFPISEDPDAAITEQKETMEQLIEGVDLPEETYPVLSRWAKDNPRYLEKILRSMVAKQGGTLQSAAINLELDLQTDNS
jgi:hypothetical protein